MKKIIIIQCSVMKIAINIKIWDEDGDYFFEILYK